MNFFNIGDFVNYLGDYSIIPPSLLRNTDVARIDDIETFNYGGGDRVERLYLFLLTTQQHIWTDSDKVRPIETNESILNKAGFITCPSSNGQGKIHVRGQITISDIQIRIPNLGYIFQTGLCIGNFSNPATIDVKRYLKEDGWDTKLFYKDFPSVNSLHELISYLKAHNVSFDISRILGKE